LLLQLNGYTVLRFLATDLTERLNEVLDSIIRVPELRGEPEIVPVWH